MTESKAKVVYVDASGTKFQLDSKPKLKWACRRGMLELDVLFEPFVDEAYDALDNADKMAFQKLLACEDPDLFAWFMGHKECEDAELNRIVQIILNRVKAS
ncbi:succinate dehydrogenase assembly factor 2 [Psychrosphaera ytuae]|uniref:FAD assembly factor SdhE n=2 Tax=Psychrosphaera ytuae TaxID=2820710 RepID=A0A975DEV6_9GAMM|nr:succinate dehydrogenase assembly factor 2 [Psychrosphaera ytuae]